MEKKALGAWRQSLEINTDAIVYYITKQCKHINILRQSHLELLDL